MDKKQVSVVDAKSNEELDIDKQPLGKLVQLN